MEKREKLEIDIDLKDLVWEIVKGWRLIVLFALIGGILMGAMSYVASYKRVNAPVVEQQENSQVEADTEKPIAQAAIDALTVDELPDVVAAVELKVQIDAKTAYLQDSLLMQIDPFKENRITLEYYLNGADVKTARDSFENLIKNSVYDENLYTNELVNIVNEGNSAVVIVEIIHKDAKTCAVLADKVKEIWEGHANTLRELGVIEAASLVNEIQNVVVDENLHTLQDAFLKECMDDQDTLAKMRADMNGAQITAYFYMWNMLYGEEATEDTTTDTTATAVETTVAPVKEKASVNLTQVILGMVVGAVLAVVYLFLAYLMTGKLRTANEVETLFGVKLLGTVHCVQKKKAFAAVDKLLWRLEHFGTKAVSEEERIRLAAASIAIQCQQKGVKEIYVTSSRIETLSAPFLTGLQKELEKKEILMQQGKEIVADADALSAAAAVGSIVFIEEERKSAYKSLLKNVQTCANNHIDLLGMVVVEM